MAKRPSTKVEGRQPVHAANNASVHTKKRPPVLRYRKKVPDISPEQQPNDDNQVDELDDTVSSNHDNQSSHESSPVKVHPIPSSSSKVYVVTVQDFLFHPRHIVVEQHSTIRWEIPANSTTVHSIVVDKAAKKKGTGRTLSPDSPTFEHTFDTLGSIRYSCSLYSFMTGTVTVVASLTPEQISRNVVFLDYPSHPTKQSKSPPKAASPTIFPFHKQLVMWREKQPAPQVSTEDDDTFAHKARQRIKTKAAAVKAAPSTQGRPLPPPSVAAASASSLPSTSSSVYVTPLSSPSRSSHHVVRIQDFDFSPLEKAHVSVGDSLAWQVSPENPGMVEHALKLRVVDGGNAVVQTATSPPLKPGDSWGFALLQPCSLSVECVVYDLTSPTIHVVANTEKPTHDNVILIGEVACPVAESVPAATPAEPEASDTILQLLHKSTLKQKATRSSYMVESGRGIPGFDAAATYDLLKLRAHHAKQEPRIVYACSRHTV